MKLRFGIGAIMDDAFNWCEKCSEQPTDTRSNGNHQKHHHDRSAGPGCNPVLAQTLFPGEAFFSLFFEGTAHSQPVFLCNYYRIFHSCDSFLHDTTYRDTS